MQAVTSDTNGHYSATITDYTGVVLVVASVIPGTTMFDEATGQTVTPTADFSMRASFVAQSGTTYSTQINPYTELATATALAKTGGLTSTNVEESNSAMAAAQPFNPLTTIPTFDANKNPINAAAVALAAISGMALKGDLGCTTGDQAAKVTCITTALTTNGLGDASIRTALQSNINEITTALGLPAQTVTDPANTGGGASAPVAATALEQAKAFINTLRSNAKALDATDLSLQTELQAVSDDMRNRTVPIVSSSVSALELAMRGAQLWRDVIANSSADFVPSMSFGTPNGGYLGSCSFNSDANYNVLATSQADANYVACGTAPDWEQAKDANGVAVYCSNIGEVCGYQWTTRVRLHPDAANPGKFTVFTQTRKATMVAGQNGITEDKNARAQYGAAFPGNASALTVQWDSNANPTTVSLAGELSPGFVSDDNWASYYNGNQWVYKLATTSVLGQKHNVALAAAMTQTGAVHKLALSGSVELIKNNALETRIELSDGSYIQGNNVGNYGDADGSQEMLLKLTGGSAASSFTGDLKLSAFKLDKSSTSYIPTLMSFSGSVQRNGVSFFDGAITGEALNHATFNSSLPISSSNVQTMLVGFVGSVIIPNRPVLKVSLSATQNDAGGANTTSLTGQYVQGYTTINLSGASSAASNIVTLESTTGLKLVVDKSKSVYPLTNSGAAVGSFNPNTNTLTYTDNTYEQF